MRKRPYLPFMANKNLSKMDPDLTLDKRDILCYFGRALHVHIARGDRQSITLKATVRGNRIVFTGGLSGEHCIAAESIISPPSRVLAHWDGYVANNERQFLGTP
jgi:hypothetical protein